MPKTTIEQVNLHLAYSGSTGLPQNRPRQQSARAAKAVWSLYVDHIKERFDERRACTGRAPCPFDNPLSYLKRSVYVLTRYLLRSSGWERDVFDAVGMAALRKEDIRIPSIEANPFHWMLLLVLPNDVLKSRSRPNGSIHSQERNRFARELLYAHQHDVPPEHLIGFIYQCGGYFRIQKQLLSGSREPWCSTAK